GVSGFNARSTAQNFLPEELAQTVSFCHARGVKVNVALNTVLCDGELAALKEVLCSVAQSGADAVIVQDLAVAALARDIAPALALHASTQMSVTNLAAAKELAAFGFQRVILARELTAAEIRHITANCGIETEIFVHGAHCMSVSGQCYMSAFYGGRSGNRGACAGPCRLPYTACGKAGPLLGLRDLSLMEHLPEIRDMGVACVKIEGRLRTPEYVAAAVDAAR
ncbi:MAG: U32 family peptidase, partial [Ruthenibacterium sp.]